MIDCSVSSHTIVRKLEIKILQVKENVSTMNDGEFRDLLLEHSAEGVCPYVVLDLSRMRFINSSGLGAIANMAMRLRKLMGELVIVSDHRELTQVFEVTKLDQTLNIVPSLDEAEGFFKG